MKTIIGIPASHYEREGIHLTAIWTYFLRILEKLEAVPLIIPATEDLSFYLDQIDGLLLTGGPDIYPPNFNLNVHPKSGPFDLNRDEVEIIALKHALLHDLPVLGICRGAQLIARYFDSDFIQDLEPPYDNHSQWTLAEKFNYVHTVKIDKHSYLAEISPESIWKVNSGHHQGIKKLGLGLRRAATSPDGLIEAFQHERHQFILGIQWHPEVLKGKEDYHFKIFNRFIESCRLWKTT